MAINLLSRARLLRGRVYGQCAPPTVSTLSDKINNQVRKHEILLLGSHLKRRCDPVCGVGSVPVCSPNSILLSFWFTLSAENWSRRVYTLLQLLFAHFSLDFSVLFYIFYHAFYHKLFGVFNSVGFKITLALPIPFSFSLRISSLLIPLLPTTAVLQLLL